MSRDRSVRTRRQLLHAGLALVGVSLLAGCRMPRWSQSARIPRVGFLTSSGRSSVADPFRSGLRDLGYVEGENIVVEYRGASGKPELIPDFTRELMQLDVDLLVVAPSSVAQGVRQVTETLPIVVAYGDPVANGLVTSLARPGGNTTGLSSSTSDLNGKRLDLLKESIPGISRVAVLRSM